MKKCPFCEHKVSFMTILLPFIQGGDRYIVCKNCAEKLSKKQSEYILWRLSSLPIGILIGKLPSWLDMGLLWYEDIIYILICVFIITLILYIFFPLRKPRKI